MSVLQSSYRPGGVGHPQAQKEYNSVAAENSVQLTRRTGRIHKLSGYNSASSTVYLQAHDSRDIPANGSVPLWSRALAGSWNFNYSEEASKLNFENGIFLTVSTTQATQTLATSNGCLFNIKYSG